MTILNSRYKNRLNIFEKFKINKDLPKYTEVPEDEVNKINRGSGRNSNTAVFTGGSVFSTYTTGSYLSTTATGTAGLTSDHTTVYIYNNVEDEGNPNNNVSLPPAKEDQGITEDDITISFNDFFGYVRHNGSFLSNMRYRRKVRALKQIIDQAEVTGQQAFADLSMAELDRLKLEYILCSKGFKTYVEEKYIVEGFKHLSEKDQDLMELEWIDEFNRVIPKKIVKRMQKANTLHCFDNYVILHIRPGWYGDKIDRVSKEEADRRKDPILFGVMNCSRRLYYIGDWVDITCHLTMGELVDKFGEGFLDMNDKTSRTNVELPFDVGHALAIEKKDRVYDSK